ncbi:MAG: type II toxin-antitoxin system VapC family toxin [Candidatus Njordarchaeota archaeon]
MTKFLDANVFIYAFYKAKKKKLDPTAKALKILAKDIIRKISKGEEKAVTSVVHLSEICNIVKQSLSIIDVASLMNSIITAKHIDVVDVTVELYKNAIAIGLNYGLEPNDALAVIIMKQLNIKDIYTFDRDFDAVEWLRRHPTDEQIKKMIEKIEKTH